MRRLEKPAEENFDVSQLKQSITQLKRRMSRLIDGYENGLLEKADFEPRILRVKERLKREEASLAKREQEVTGEEDLRLLAGDFESFAEQIREGLEHLDTEQKRKILKHLIKQIEVDRDEFRIVYKVQPTPFVPSPDKRGFLQDWLRPAGTRGRVGLSILDHLLRGRRVGIRDQQSFRSRSATGTY